MSGEKTLKVSTDRIERLLKLVESSPDDPFPRYGLAMEYRNAGRLEEAATGFLELIERHPDYVATYLHCGLCLEEMDDEERAAEVYRSGVEAARKAENSRALQELQAALSMIEE